MTVESPRTFSILTKTYKGDYNSFCRLCDSIDRHSPGVTHYVLIDRSDRRLFARFASPTRHLIDCRDLLPDLREFNLGKRRLWWKPPHRIVRGWIYQQLAKLACVASLEEEAILLVDSDALFIGPLKKEHVFDGDRLFLFHNPGQADGEEFARWHNVALRSFGLPETGYTGYDYITQGVIWSPAIVRAMLARIEKSTGLPWIDALIRNFRFSEYVLYGVFCEQVEGPHRQTVNPTSRELCHCSWHYDLSGPAGIEHFVASRKDHQIAVLIQSNLGMAEAQRNAILNRFEPRGV